MFESGSFWCGWLVRIETVAFTGRLDVARETRGQTRGPPLPYFFGELILVWFRAKRAGSHGPCYGKSDGNSRLGDDDAE